jgi:hypothetical protein
MGPGGVTSLHFSSGFGLDGQPMHRQSA